MPLALKGDDHARANGVAVLVAANNIEDTGHDGECKLKVMYISQIN
jgi:hypothetical protein